MGFYDLYEEEFKIFAMEYNNIADEPSIHLEHYVDTLRRHQPRNK
jgi:hypothetical protein